MKQMQQQRRPASNGRSPADREARPQPARTSATRPADGPSAVEVAFRRAVTERIPGWVFAPLRLFLGITFVYAGIQKLTDPRFFNPKAAGYIGKQIQGFATGSPIHGLLMNVALPHASLFGGLVAWGEIAIGVGALLGLLLRPAAFFGALLSLIFFLSASWHVRPYFYGADIVFIFAWLTLMLAGPLAGGLPAVDPWLARWLTARFALAEDSSAAAALALALGAQPVASTPSEVVADASASPASRAHGAGRAQAQRRNARAMARRDFLRGAVTGGGVMLVAAWLWSLTHPATDAGSTTVPAGSTTGGSAGAGSSTGSNQIALASDVPANSAAAFTIPSSGDPGVLVHLNSGKFVAFDAVCTHAGCTVEYDNQSQMLLCPCHGAAFDPSQGANVVQGPAPTPLTTVPVNVNQSTGAITLS